MLCTAVALAVLAAVAGVTLAMTPQYTAATRLFFAVEGTESVTDLAQGSTFAEKQMTSYVEVASSPLVLEPVIRQLGLLTSPTELAPSVAASVPTGTVILQVAVTRADREEAAAIANAIGAELSTVVVSGLSPERGDGKSTVKATVLTPALTPGAPSSPNLALNLGIGLALGLFLGVTVALLSEVLNTKIRGDADVRALTDGPLLGAIAFDDAVPTHPVMVADQPLSAPSEAIRRLRTNLQFVGAGSGSKSVVITSSIPGEGKSTTAINLAVSLADAGSRVVLVDADLRRPSVAEYLGLEGRAGLTSVLIGRADVEDVIQPWRDSGLDVLPSGQVPPNPSELLGSPAMVELVAKLEASYDVVLLDTPPLLPVTDATILTKLVGGALVVVGADRIHRAQLAESLETLETADARLHGLVLNKIARRDARPYVYENGYYSSKIMEEEVPVVTSALALPSVPGTTAARNGQPARAAGATALLNGRKPG
jgi:capsular exopolysaccharide synthesis family protein